ncbi:MAG: hypothetical protein M1814_001660 [Vezdaea aestivalis]|nr:MAG: hypothetical protein M1814_001660 [Vezdaea aestivalis]
MSPTLRLGALLLYPLLLRTTLAEPLQVDKRTGVVFPRADDGFPTPASTPPRWDWEDDVPLQTPGPVAYEIDPDPETDPYRDVKPGGRPVEAVAGSSRETDHTLPSAWFSNRGLGRLRDVLPWTQMRDIMRSKEYREQEQRDRERRIEEGDGESQLASLLNEQTFHDTDNVDIDRRATGNMYCSTSQNMENISPNPFFWDSADLWKTPSLGYIDLGVYGQKFLNVCAKKRNALENRTPNVGCECRQTAQTVSTGILELFCPEPPVGTPSHDLWKEFNGKCRQFCSCLDQKKHPFAKLLDKINVQFKPTSTERERDPTPTPAPSGKATVTMSNGVVVVINGKAYRVDGVRKKYKNWRDSRREGNQRTRLAQCAATDQNIDTCVANYDKDEPEGNMFSQVVPLAKCGASCVSNAECISESGDRGCRCVASPTADQKRAAGLDPIGWSSPVCLTLSLVIAATRPGGLGGKLNGRSMEEAGESLKEGMVLDPVCPCNRTYVSHSCCESESGLVWEPPHYKMGQLDL